MRDWFYHNTNNFKVLGLTKAIFWYEYKGCFFLDRNGSGLMLFRSLYSCLSAGTSFEYLASLENVSDRKGSTRCKPNSAPTQHMTLKNLQFHKTSNNTSQLISHMLKFIQKPCEICSWTVRGKGVEVRRLKRSSFKLTQLFFFWLMWASNSFALFHGLLS